MTTTKSAKSAKSASKAAPKAGKSTPAKSPPSAAGKPLGKAPAFSLETDAGGKATLADYAGKWLVLYFYPRDNTPGCTREGQAFTKAAAGLKKLGAEVAGVSRDSVASHVGFKDKCGIGITLLSDPDLKVHKAYGAYGTKVLYGKKTEGVIRSTFLVSPDGRIAKSFTGVKVDGHAEKVVEALKAAQAS